MIAELLEHEPPIVSDTAQNLHVNSSNTSGNAQYELAKIQLQMRQFQV